MNRNIGLSLVCALFFIVSGVCAEESITITTYYPSPQGNYKTLKTRRLAVGDTYSTLKWVDEGGTIPNDVDLVVEQKVGINTTTPTAMLSIFGGQLGTNVDDTILMQELDSNTCCENQSLRFFAQRANPGSDWLTADLVLQRKVDSDNMGFIKWPGGEYGIDFGRDSTTYMKISGDGIIYTAGEVASDLQYGDGQFRAVRDNYGTIFRQDGNDFWILMTPNGSPYGIWNDYRPFRIFNSGQTVQVGRSVTYPTNFTLWGTFTHNGSSKTFIIEHPLGQDKYLVHGTLEGPENAVFYRGTAELSKGVAEVVLPDYVEAFTSETGRTVLVTPVFNDLEEPVSALAASMVKNGRFFVRAIDKANPSQVFSWEVKAVRKDVKPLLVEPDKDQIEVRGDGPYKYYNVK